MYNSINDFDYPLPEHLIAQTPQPDRTSSRLMQVSPCGNDHIHLYFSSLPSLLKPNDLLVLNNTRVVNARLYGKKTTGGQVECFVDRVLPGGRVRALIRASKAPRVGSLIDFEAHITAEVIARHDDLFELQFNVDDCFAMLAAIGRTPLPPYITRHDDEADQTRYQTVYAEHEGAVAAPTAGLHFTQTLLDSIRSQGVEIGTVTLHVGSGTFQPVRVTNLDQHNMHSEYYEVAETLCDQVSACRRKGGRVIAVGTTSLRALESSMVNGQLQPNQGDTALFIRPGYTFQCVDLLITNFHLPKSTLMMLVTAFGGYETMMNAYKTAIDQEYRFFSYGDAMIIERSEALQTRN